MCIQNITVNGDKRKALDAAKQIEAKLVLGDIGLLDSPSSKKPTFEEYAKIWLEDYIKPLRRQAGIREMRLHDIRHTYASLLLSRGESPVYVKEQLGHSSIQMTVDIYGHLIPSSNRGAVNQLDSPQPSATYPQPA